jgi:hypothetical protein
MECRENCKPRNVFHLMDLPINDKDLATIINALSLGGDTRLYHLLKEVKQVRELEEDGGVTA